MTNELTMRKSNLVLPVSGYELDREEMCYVEGGGTLRFNFGICLSPGLVAGLIGGQLTRIIMVKAGIIGAGFGGIIGGIIVSLIAGTMVQFIANSIYTAFVGNVPYYQLFSTGFSVSGWLIPNATLNINFGSLGL